MNNIIDVELDQTKLSLVKPSEAELSLDKPS